MQLAAMECRDERNGVSIREHSFVAAFKFPICVVDHNNDTRASIRE